MHKRQQIRELAATAIAVIVATIDQERAARVNEGARPLVVVSASAEAIEAADGTMGQPQDRRALDLRVDVYTAAPTGRAAVDQANDLEVAVGAQLGAAMQPGGSLVDQVLDLRWTSTEITTDKSQEAYLATAAITYAVTYDAWFGDPT